MFGLPDVVYGLGIAAATAVVAVVLVVVVGLTLLFRNRQGARPTAASGLAALTTQAGALLVRADEAVSGADNELGYALAQFGDERTSGFAETVSLAKQKLQEAFRLRQRLDDSEPESDQKSRQWTLQIIALCENVVASLEQQDRTFTSKRGEELDAPKRLRTVRQAISAASDRLTPTEERRAELAERYDNALLRSLNNVSADVRRLLDEASEHCDNAESGISPAGVNAVTDHLSQAEDRVHRAALALDAVDAREHELAAASAALVSLVASAQTDVTEAKERRDAAPDPESGATILAAIESVTAALGAATSQAAKSDPERSIASLAAAIESLDAALASARNQKERLEHARTALVGTLISARSQISEVRNYISGGSSRVGADARTRLAEADRQLMLAEAEADPVEALDAARRAVTHARDADALARYSAMGRN
ncbi:MAG: hypothetical protein ACOH1J_09385 [Microbacteriaceae bacterium]